MKKLLTQRFTQFRLEDWNHIRAEFDWIYDGPVKPQYRESTLQHPGQSVFLIRCGKLLIRTDKGTVHGKPGQWIIPRQGSRLQQFSPDAQLLSIHFHLNWPGGQPLFDWDVAARLEASKIPQLEASSTRLRRLTERRLSAAKERMPASTSSLSDHFLVRAHFSKWLHGFLDILLAQGFIPSRLGQLDPRLIETVHALDRLPLGTSFREEGFARRVNLSVSQLDRLFARQFGTTPRRYFENRKLEEAMAHVREATSIKEVAFALGFSSLPHFSGWFKHKTGLSPTEFQHEQQPAKAKAKPRKPRQRGRQ